MKRALASLKGLMVVVLSRSKLTVGDAIIGLGFLTEMNIIGSKNYKGQVVFRNKVDSDICRGKGGCVSPSNRRITVSTSEVLDQGHVIWSKKLDTEEKQLLAWHRALVGMETLTMGCLVIMRLKLPSQSELFLLYYVIGYRYRSNSSKMFSICY